MNNYKKMLAENGMVAFVPKGESMWPTLKSNKQTVILISKTERLKKYDVGLFIRKNGQYVLHRVIEVLKDGYVFIGDGQDFTEEIKEENVIAVMEGFYCGKKYVSANSSKYLKNVEKYFSNEGKRLKKIKKHLKALAIKNKLLSFFGKKQKRDIE